jgi:hypothetical protein
MLPAAGPPRYLPCLLVQERHGSCLTGLAVGRSTSVLPTAPTGRQVFSEACDRRRLGVIQGQIMARDVQSSRPEGRSDDGQTILNTALEAGKCRFTWENLWS